MKQLTILLAVPAILLFSCSNQPAKEDSKSSDSTATDTTAKAETKPAFIPYKVVTIQSKVKNFEKWEKEYFADDSLRKANGITHLLVGRDLKDSNMVYALAKMDDMEKTMAYSKLRNLKETSKEAGLVGSPGFSYGEVVREDESPTESNDRLGVAHHVKDYANWLKSYDSSGTTRGANGLTERSISRSLVDSNMIYITFVVNDMAKAKARMASPELKKAMADAGVDSPPTVRWYRIVK